jgi:hypothetical protein
LDFEKNANFLAENWQKTPKIGKKRRKLAKIAENFDYYIDPCKSHATPVFGDLCFVYF